MLRFVALFRGINVGKAKRIAMADLRALLESLGYADVSTLLNSGNAVFEAAAAPAEKHAYGIRDAVARQLGVDALVVVKSAREIAAIVAGNKLAAVATDPSRLLVAVTNQPAALQAIEALGRTGWGEEEVLVGKHAAYVWCPQGILQSKAGAALLKGLAESGTTRNWATIEKLHALLQAGAAPTT
ncbi:DUF1697 domain-containing protein [Caenimonas terrae]|uniref:DUF1697 domain-containing protein n=1 Tax=Caenimonas terrae TaxID=696074 RepID=A0ABW0NIR0_9BURK